METDADDAGLRYLSPTKAVTRQFAFLLLCVWVALGVIMLDTLVRGLITNPLEPLAGLGEQVMAWSTYLGEANAQSAPALIAIVFGGAQLVLSSRLRTPGESMTKTRNRTVTALGVLSATSGALWLIALPSTLLTSSSLAPAVSSGILPAVALFIGIEVARHFGVDRRASLQNALDAATAAAQWRAHDLPGVPRRHPWRLLLAASAVSFIVVACLAVSAGAAMVPGVEMWRAAGFAAIAMLLLAFSTSLIVAGASAAPGQRALNLFGAWSLHVNASLGVGPLVAEALRPLSMQARPGFIVTLSLAVLASLGLGVIAHWAGRRHPRGRLAISALLLPGAIRVLASARADRRAEVAAMQLRAEIATPKLRAHDLHPAEEYPSRYEAIA